MSRPKLSALAVTLFGSLLMGNAAYADSLQHIDDLALQAQRQARRLAYQTYAIRQYEPAGHALTSDAMRLMRLASHIHELAHVDHRYGHHRAHGNRIPHIHEDVRQLDRLLHQMQDRVIALKARCADRRPHHPAHSLHSPGNVRISVGRNFSVNVGRNSNLRYQQSYSPIDRSWQVRNPYHQQHPGHYGNHGYGRTLAALNQIEASLAGLEVTVHHLLEDTGVRCFRR